MKRYLLGLFIILIIIQINCKQTSNKESIGVHIFNLKNPSPDDSYQFGNITVTSSFNFEKDSIELKNIELWLDKNCLNSTFCYLGLNSFENSGIRLYANVESNIKDDCLELHTVSPNLFNYFFNNLINDNDRDFISNMLLYKIENQRHIHKDIQSRLFYITNHNYNKISNIDDFTNQDLIKYWRKNLKEKEIKYWKKIKELYY